MSDNSTSQGILESGNDACTKAKLVAVKGCNKCWLRFTGQVRSYCMDRRHIVGVDITENVTEDGSFHPACPLLTGSKPNAGVRIVAEVEA